MVLDAPALQRVFSPFYNQIHLWYHQAPEYNHLRVLYVLEAILCNDTGKFHYLFIAFLFLIRQNQNLLWIMLTYFSTCSQTVQAIVI